MTEIPPTPNTSPSLKPEDRIPVEELADFRETPSIYASTVSKFSPTEDRYNKPHSVLMNPENPRYLQAALRAGDTYYVISYRTGRFHELTLSEDVMRRWQVREGVDRVELSDGATYFQSGVTGLYHRIYRDEEGVEKVQEGIDLSRELES